MSSSPSALRVLILCTKYSLKCDSPYLSDELAAAISRAGHDVEIIYVDWAGTESQFGRATTTNGPIVNVVPTLILNRGPLRWRQVIKWAISPVRACWAAWRIDRLFAPDVVVCFSPLTALALPVLLLTRDTDRRRFMVQWDFFPDSHFEDGVLNGNLKRRFLRWLESYLMRRFTAIGCMSPRNIEYMRSHCNLRGRVAEHLLPLWSSMPPYEARARDIIRRDFDLPNERPVFVFGGQLISGRGIEDVLEAATLATQDGAEFSLIFIGKGPKAKDIHAKRAATTIDLRVLDSLPRNQYLELLSACDVGLVTTLNVTVPTFPSKTLDYLQTGTMILASVAASTDYGAFIEQTDVGIQVPAGNISAMVIAIKSLCRSMPLSEEMRKQKREHSRRILREYFSADIAAEIVLGKRDKPNWLPISELDA